MTELELFLVLSASKRQILNKSANELNNTDKNNDKIDL